MIQAGYLLKGYNSTEYIKDCGTPSRLFKVRNDFITGKIMRSNLNFKQKAIFLDRDGTINKETGHLYKINQFELIPNAGLAISELNKSDYLTCVVTNQPVIARGDCSINDLRMIHNKMETLLGLEGAYLDRIYYCPHHTTTGFANENIKYKINCNCRKPLTGMIDKAINELNIEKNESWFIGDTTTDIYTAKNSGIKSILVETGYAGLDQKYLVSPDFIVPDLLDAVSFILDVYPKISEFAGKLANNISYNDKVIIGGLSRSGKTTFASILYYALNQSGKKAHILSLDRWLKNEKDRKTGVKERYDLNEFINLIDSIDNINETTIFKLPAYNKMKKQKIENVDSLKISKNDIIIIEGTIALGLGLKSKNKVHKYFIKIDENIRKKRIIKEYELRGESLEKSFEIYSSRQDDESPIINELQADCLEINMGEFYLNK
jgi:histidinol-phosphate phosphatase family protein